MADVWFTRDRSDEPAPALSDLLAEAPGSVTGLTETAKPQGGSPTQAPGMTGAVPGAAAGLVPGSEDELRQPGPLI